MGTYTVEYLENATPLDISNFVMQLDDTHLYSDGRISTSSLTLQSQFGDFVTRDNSGATPILKQFDRLKLSYISIDGLSYSKIFEIMDDLGQFTKQANYLLPLTLKGREWNLGTAPFSGYFDPPLDHFKIFDEILRVYADTRGNKQVSITFDPLDIELPEYNPNFWDFQYIDNCLDAIKSVVKLADQSVAAGGAGDRFSIIFEDIDKNFMLIKIISQGTTSTTNGTMLITGDALLTPLQSIAKIKQPLTGTAVIARGRPGSGGMPKEGDIYRSRLEYYQRILVNQVWSPTIQYRTDALTNQGGQVFEAINDSLNDRPPSANWQTLDAGDYIGSTIQYSPLTLDKAVLFRNECVNPEGAFDPESENSPKMLDYNIFIDDVETQRDWVHFRSNTDILLKTDPRAKYLWRSDAGLNAKVFEGIRILVDTSLGAAAGAFAENNFGTGAGFDPNGKPYADNQCVFTNNKWFVVKEHEDFDQTLSRFDGLFEFNSAFVNGSRFPASDKENPFSRRRANVDSASTGWQELGGQFLANDCLHSPSSITNIDGLIDPVAKPGGGFYSDNSAVRIIYEYGNKTELDIWDSTLNTIAGIFATATGFLGNFALNAAALTFDLFTTPFYRNVGWWITLSAPFPVSTFNAITEEVGELYGGQTLNQLENHPYFDTFNQRVALSGKAGFNEEDSEDLMEITGVTFLYRLDILADSVRIPFKGAIPCAYWCMDSNGTLWKNSKTYRLLGDIQRMTFDFGDFSPVYRARSPFGISNVVTNILTPELEIRERLFPARIVMQGFQLEGAYDDHGRYMPNFWENIIKPTIFAMFSSSSFSTSVEFVGDFDYFQWVKTPIAIAKDESFDRIIFSEIKDYPTISSIEQLNRAALADIDVETFQYEQYTITQNDRADITLQETVFIEEPNLINDNDLLTTELSVWSGASIPYTIGRTIIFGGTVFQAIQDHISDNSTNDTTNTNLWKNRGSSTISNTRKVVAGEIVLSVTNGKNWERQMTFPRRIPRVVA